MIFNIHVLQASTENKWLLYALFVFSLLYVADLAMHGDYRVVSVFILVAFISSFFTKNMIFILGLALFVSWMLSDEIKKSTILLEGFDDATDMLDGLLKEEEEEEIPRGSTSTTLFKGVDEEEEDTKKKSSKKEKMTSYNENDLDAIKEQTKQLLDTHNELLKNVEKLRPYLREAGDFTKTLSKFMEQSEPAKID
jgi:hypothetical protein